MEKDDIENKSIKKSNCSIKKSTPSQLQHLADYMEENAQFARGAPVFGCTKQSAEQQWRDLVDQLNSLGPPVRTTVEWKKTWADLKSRTKRKIAENKNNMRATGGGQYSFNSLTTLEQQIDRTLCLSVSAAPKGKSFGVSEDAETFEQCFEVMCSPPRGKNPVVVVTPTKQKHTITQKQSSSHENSYDHAISGEPRSGITSNGRQHKTKQQTRSRRPSSEESQQHTREKASKYHPTSSEQNSQPRAAKLSMSYSNASSSQQEQSHHDEFELPSCSSGKKRKTIADEQLALIRRQIRLGEQAAGVAKEHVDATKMLVNAGQRIADAVEKQADAAAESSAAIKMLVHHISIGNIAFT